MRKIGWHRGGWDVEVEILPQGTGESTYWAYNRESEMSTEGLLRDVVLSGLAMTQPDRTTQEQIAELKELLCWHATPDLEDHHREGLVEAYEGDEYATGQCELCLCPWPCPTERARVALKDHVCPALAPPVEVGEG